jgi:phenylalanyl-tRNA synthetase beta chain
VARHNLHHGAVACRFVEHDKVFAVGPDGLSSSVERWELAGVVAEPAETRHWSGVTERFDLFALKGMLGAWCRRMRIEGVAAAPFTGEPFAVGEAFRLEGGALRAVAGRIDARIAAEYDVPRSVWLFACDLDPLLPLTAPARCYKETSRFPPVKRDLAFVVAATVSHAEVLREMRAASGGLVRRIRLFDVYEGSQIPAGRKSLAYALDFQSDDRSLEGAEVDRQVERIVARVGEACGATLRDQ